MASKFTCRCGDIVRTNLYEGHDLHLLVPETATDLGDAERLEPCGALVDSLVLDSQIVATCSNCGALALIDNAYNIKLYVPVT